MKEEMPVKVMLENPLTLEDIKPPETWYGQLDNLVGTKIYAGGERIDSGWTNNRNTIIRKRPTQIPRKYRGKLLKSMRVMVNTEDRMTIETIFATYTENVTVEYGFFVKE